ncbi:RNA degradosome polyphosphate kinase [Varibaculum cambriense]|uniref:RNA degradosome polyphosphate kinase n=1 Tax=Varibaculum cambriense TaxID=184870 RepID=UPI00290C0CC6|nr:RNA degradosome polyphosphate kinase [Varibaculum cambriense]MDU7407312.1 RNA degradosome polyphosphate kinase [Varibaculum cambriense]
MDSKPEADNRPEPKVGKAKIKEDAQGDSHVVPSPADIARFYKENPQTEAVAQVDRVAAQSNFETATADELISSKTSPEQFPGTDYEDADYDLPTGSSPFVDGRKINIDEELLPRPKITVPAGSDQNDKPQAVSKDSKTATRDANDKTGAKESSKETGGAQAKTASTKPSTNSDKEAPAKKKANAQSAAVSAGHAQTDGPEDLSKISPSTLREAPGIDKLAQAGPLGQDKPLPKGRFGDRELSWMQFNQRVLEQAEDERLPILERAWFTTIFSSNLDEFYMVRVAGLKRRIAAGIARTAASGLTPRQVLDLVTERAQVLCARQAGFVQNTLLGELEEVGIKLRRWDDLAPEQQDFLHGYFRRLIFPILTPLAVDPSHPFPYISGLSVNLAVVVRNPLTGKQHFARVKIPESLPRLICVEQAIDQVSPEDAIDTNGEATFITLEDVIGPHLDHLFPGMEILEHHVFRLTRNEDLEVEEDDAENLLTAMEQELLRRRFGPAVRLEVAKGISRPVLDFLVAKLEIGMEDVFSLPEPIDLRCLNELHELDLPELKYQKFVPATAAGLAEVESATPTDIFAMIRSHDVLLHHPYDSFSTSVQHFVTYAARDPKVRSLKQTLYRTSSDSPIVSALIEAAQNGKQVLAIVEIKARFDEDANISWARKLERAGVHVVYGMVGLKTHCKLSMVVREESDGLRRYCHVGTGNYHPKTARGYEDLGLLTCDREVAQDLTRLFNQLSGYAPRTSFQRLLVAPRSIRPGIIERIEREVENHRQGLPAYIGIKVNSLVDEAVTDALYRASQAGVPIDIVVRGICTIRSGVRGLSENIRVRSILGRFLEHSRIYAFENAGQPEVWIGSADLMHRNLDRRVEALIRIKDPDMTATLMDLVKLEASPEVSSWHLRRDGTWRRHIEAKDGSPLMDIQEYLINKANSRMKGR